MYKIPSLSIIIPTHNSQKTIQICIQAIVSGSYPSRDLEIIAVDNMSKDNTVKILKGFGLSVYELEGIPPQVCCQRNLGALKANGDYLFFLDHDMQLSKNLFSNFLQKDQLNNGRIDAWYIPERIISNNKIWAQLRTFERDFYNATVVDAARIIKREKFNATGKFDETLSSGPADWDLDIQLRRMGCSFGILDECIYHHEHNISFSRYLQKKSQYTIGSKRYQKKWKLMDKQIYRGIVKKQYSFLYRFIVVFLENGKWIKLCKGIHLFIGVLIMRILVGFTYLLKSVKIRLQGAS